MAVIALNRDLQGGLPFPKRVFFAYDTRNVICADADESVLDQVVGECLRLHRVFNRFSADSEISQLNRSLGRSFTCSDDVSLLLWLSLALHGESEGAFNPAIGSVCDLWDFSQERFEKPGPAQLERALACADLSKAGFSDDGSIILPEGMSLDLGGVAKGYAAERAALMLMQAGAGRGFVNFGGTIAVIGPKPDGSSWTFGLQREGSAYGESFWALLDAAEGSFATSARYYRGVEEGGVRYHHIIDPRMGHPVQNGVSEVTVHCAGAAMADALSTTLFVMGPDEGLAFASDLGAAALFRMQDGSVRASSGFPVRILEGGR